MALGLGGEWKGVGVQEADAAAGGGDAGVQIRCEHFGQEPHDPGRGVESMSASTFSFRADCGGLVALFFSRGNPRGDFRCAPVCFARLRRVHVVTELIGGKPEAGSEDDRGCRLGG